MKKEDFYYSMRIYHGFVFSLIMGGTLTQAESTLPLLPFVLGSAFVLIPNRLFISSFRESWLFNFRFWSLVGFGGLFAYSGLAAFVSPASGLTAVIWGVGIFSYAVSLPSSFLMKRSLQKPATVVLGTMI